MGGTAWKAKIHRLPHIPRKAVYLGPVATGNIF